jgi:hypothetical protein
VGKNKEVNKLQADFASKKIRILRDLFFYNQLSILIDGQHVGYIGRKAKFNILD